jgi:cell division protein FtsW
VSTTAGRLQGLKAPSWLARLKRAWTQAGTQRTSTYLLLVMVIAVLNVVGVVMVLSASSVQSLDTRGTAWWFFERQLMWTGLGIVGFAVASRIDYRQWRRYTVPFLVAATVLLVIVLIPGVGIWVDGSRRWLGYSTWRLQPSEIAKLALLVFAADVLARRERQVGDWKKALAPVLFVFGLFAFLIMLEPDLASTMVLTIILGAVLVVGGIRTRHLAAIAGLAIGAVTLFALAVPWRRARMLAFVDPWADKGNTGYQVTQSLIALGSGGWTGVGLGASRAKWRFLPAAHTDFIFAIIGEELGLLGCVLVVGLFVALAYLGVRTALRAPDRFGMLLAGGVTAWIVGQAVINIGSVVGLLPVSGVPLPFVSFGGTALLFTMIAAGLLGNVARQGGR